MDRFVGERVGVRTQDLQIKRNCDREITDGFSTAPVSKLEGGNAPIRGVANANLETNNSFTRSPKMSGYHSLNDMCRGAMVRIADVKASVFAEGIPGRAVRGDFLLTRANAAKVSAIILRLRAGHRVEAAAVRGQPARSSPIGIYRLDEQVYFIRCAEFVKIGYALSPVERLRDLQSANPFPLTLVATVAGGRPVEQKWHRRFSEYHRTQEWFRFEGALQGAIEALPPYVDERLRLVMEAVDAAYPSPSPVGGC